MNEKQFATYISGIPIEQLARGRRQVNGTTWDTYTYGDDVTFLVATTGKDYPKLHASLAIPCPHGCGQYVATVKCYTPDEFRQQVQQPIANLDGHIHPEDIEDVEVRYAVFGTPQFCKCIGTPLGGTVILEGTSFITCATCGHPIMGTGKRQV